jgi:hypothetical protein
MFATMYLSEALTMTNFWTYVMTIKHGLHIFFLIDMKVTAKILWPRLYLR